MVSRKKLHICSVVESQKYTYKFLSLFRSFVERAKTETIRFYKYVLRIFRRVAFTVFGYSKHFSGREFSIVENFYWRMSPMYGSMYVYVFLCTYLYTYVREYVCIYVSSVIFNLPRSLAFSFAFCRSTGQATRNSTTRPPVIWPKKATGLFSQI